MSRDIAESDWRHFKKVRQELLERFCRQTLEDSIAIANSSKGTAHECYLKVYKLIEDRDHDIAKAFNDLRRSTAVMQLLVMRRMKLLTDKDMEGFFERIQKILQFEDDW